MLSLVDEHVLTIEKLVDLMCHNQAELFSVRDRGFLKKGYKADITIVRRSEKPWTVSKENIQSKCGWSPLEGRQFAWNVCQTILNGKVVYDNGVFDMQAHGEPIMFR